MQDQTEATPWRIIENQIACLRVFENRIEDLRSLLAEDWQIRLSRRKDSAVSLPPPVTAAVPSMRPS